MDLELVFEFNLSEESSLCQKLILTLKFCNSLTLSTKAEHIHNIDRSQQFYSYVYSREMYVHVLQDTYTEIFIPELFIIANTDNNSKVHQV